MIIPFAEKQARMEFLREEYGLEYPCGHDRTVLNTMWDRRKDRAQLAAQCKICRSSADKRRRAKTPIDPVNYPCGHPKTPENSKKAGGGRLRCKQCHLRYVQKYAAQRVRNTKAEKYVRPEQPTPGDWQLRGACRDSHLPADTWFENNQTQRSKALQKQAKAVCRTCPVRRLCLAAGVAEPYGLWGGSGEELRAEFRLGRLTLDELEQRAAG